MITALSKRISFFLYRKKIVEYESIDVYQYGFEIVISTIIGFLITLVLGLLFKMVLLSFLYYIIFVTLRQFTGGYHANTYLTCNSIYAFTTIVIFGMTKLSAYSELYTINFHVTLLIFSVLTVWFCSPIENKNKPFTEKQKRRNHWCGFLITVFLSVISCLLFQMAKSISALITFTLFIITLMIVIAIPIGKEVKEHE